MTQALKVNEQKKRFLRSMQQEYTFQTRMEKQEEMTETRLAPVTQTKSEKQKTRITRHVVSPPFLQAPES